VEWKMPKPNCFVCKEPISKGTGCIYYSYLIHKNCKNNFKKHLNNIFKESLESKGLSWNEKALELALEECNE